jgi:hypothetical protein
MQTAFETIRALKTRFVVAKNSSDEFSFTVDKAELGEGHGSATLRFLNPTHVWGAVWDDAASEWRDLPGFRLPEHGEINEAFVKPVGRRLKVSFTDKKTPLLRWGFTAESVEATAQE